MKKIKRALFVSALLTFALSCGEAVEQEQTSDENAGEMTEENVEVDMQNESEFQLSLIIANNIAAPVKLLTDMNQAGVDLYRDGVANPVESLENYQTADQKAIAFGVYGADLSYISLYERHDEMADYLIAIRKLAEDLGLSSLFDQSSFEDFERIKTDPDSVKMFIFSKYDSADEYLRANDRLVTACLVLTGGLIESLHLVSAQIEAGEANKESYKIFLGQKNTLKSLVELFNNLENEGHAMNLKDDVQMLLDTFEKLDSYDKFSKENVHSLHEAIDAVRDKLV
ncbi:MAG TPA: hypothetical protein DCX54_07090 [Flavobacteriales bacterium]|nr:hypothetical protein [Flavobacteriales bacterium]